MDETIHKVCDDADEMGVRGGFAEGQSGEQMEESHRKMEDSDGNEVEGSLWDMSGTVLHVQGATDDNFQRSAEEVRTGIEALSISALNIANKAIAAAAVALAAAAVAEADAQQGNIMAWWPGDTK